MKKLLTTKDAGKILGVSPLRVFQLIKAGRLPAVKIGRDWMIKERDLEKVKDRKPGRPRGKNSEDRAT
jgi:excisionase family DNA binding protein